MTTRVFAPEGSSTPSIGDQLELDDDESHYLLKVRRVRLGGEVELLDGHGGVWLATLASAKDKAPRRATLTITAERLRPEPRFARVLLLGAPDPPALLDALTGATELGASEIVLVECVRSQGRVPSRERIDRVLRAAQRQCGRPRAPRLHGPWSLAQALEHRRELSGWFAWEGTAVSHQGDIVGEPGREAPLDPIDPTADLRLMVGPEGGFSDDEVRMIAAAGLRPASLGPWILRTPTAVVALLARAWG